MNAYLVPAIASLLIPAAYLLAAAKGRFRHAATLWLAWPAILYCLLIVWEVLTRPSAASSLTNALLGFSLLSAFLLIPWLTISALVLGIAWMLRRYLKRTEQAPTARLDPEVQPEPEPVRSPGKPASPMAHEGEEVLAARPWDIHCQTSPDGTIRVDFEPIEWYRDAWLSPPRVTEVASGKILLDLFNQDWDMAATFPGSCQVILDGQRFNGAGVTVILDLDNDIFQILQARNVKGPFPPAPLSLVAQGLEEISQRSFLATQAIAGHQPPIKGPRVNWVAALLVLGGLLAAIGLIAFLAYRAEESGRAPTIAVPPDGFRPAILERGGMPSS